MKKRFGKNFICFLSFLIVALFSFKASAQLTLDLVDAGPYTPGSTIAATFAIGPTCIQQSNVFELYLSNSSGTFTPETKIGSYTGFYSTYINGIIPAGTAPGTYRVRIKSTAPSLVTLPSFPITIKAGAAVTAKLTSNLLNASDPETFGTCNTKANNSIALTNESTASSTVTATIKNELSGTGMTNLFFDTPNKIFTAQLAHYTVFSKAQMADGTVGTKAYLIVNNKAITAFATTNNNVVCLPQGFLEFNVDYISPGGIQSNFPGDRYVVDWGDGNSNVYSICDIKNLLGQVKHEYTTSSCGMVSNTTSGKVFNAFNVSINVSNAFCGNIGTAISSYAKVIVRPINQFTFNPVGCTNSQITFTNTSVQGDNPETSSTGCIPNVLLFNWFVDGVLVAIGKPISYKLQWTFTTNGNHTIRLESSNTGSCDATPYEQTICIQNKPKPAFSFSQTTICAPTVLKPADASIIDEVCSAGNTYSWSVTPAVGYVGGTNSASKEPQFNFTVPGVYTVVLNINTASCGAISSLPQKIIVNQNPTAVLSPDVTLCNLAAYDFINTTSGPTKTIFTGTNETLATTYQWTVIGGAYTFTNGTNANSQYPSIQFDEYTLYTVTVTHTNGCGSVTKSQKIQFTQAPKVESGPNQTICYNQSLVKLDGKITTYAGGTITGQTWIGGNGNFLPDRNTLNATYQPTTAERDAGTVTLTLSLNTSMAPPCNRIDDDIKIFIAPKIFVTSTTQKDICTGTSANYTITSSVPGTTFTWSATGSAGAGGYAASGSGNLISNILTNSDPINNAQVTYSIIPTANGCQGDTFTLTVNVAPNPVLSATAINSTICSLQNRIINLSSNLPDTRYKWSSTADAGISGNSSNVTPIVTTTINDLLSNSGTTTAAVTYTIVPISAKGCEGSPVHIQIFIEPLPTAPNAGPDDKICSASSYTLRGNNPIVGKGKWTQATNFSGVTFNDDSKYNATVSGLQEGNTYIFTWTTASVLSCGTKSDNVSIEVTPQSIGGITNGTTSFCSGNTNSGSISLTNQVGQIIRWEKSTDHGTTWSTISSTANPYVFTNVLETTLFRAVVLSGICAEAYSAISTITINPVVLQANAGMDQVLCNATSTILSGNIPFPNTGLWTILSGPAGVVLQDASSYNTSVSGLIPGATYIFKWTISGMAPCPPSSDDIMVKVNVLSNGGITSGSQSFCSGTANSGTITLTGQTGVFTGWEKSEDNGSTWIRMNETANPLIYSNLSKTTVFRAIVQNGNCPEVRSSTSTITINPVVVIADAGDDQVLCNVNSAVLKGNNPMLFNGLWILTSGQSGVVITNPAAYNTSVTGLTMGQTYNFKWTISGSAPCPSSSDDVTIKINSPSVGGITQGSISVCPGSSNLGSITLTGYNGNIIRWEKSTDGGMSWISTGTIANPLVFINVALTTQFRAIVQNGNCAESISGISTVTVNEITPIANAGPNQSLCSGNSILLNGSNPVSNTGIWTVVSAQAGVVFENDHQFNTKVSGLIPGQTYTFRWTINGKAPCASTFSETSVIYQNPLINNISATAMPLCAGQEITLTGEIPGGGIGNYTYQWQRSRDGEHWTDIDGGINKNLELLLNESTFFRRLVNSGVCSVFSNEVKINVLASLGDNIISGNQNVCAGTSVQELTGSLPTGGNGSYNYQWQKSLDNGLIWADINGATGQSFIPPVPTDPVFYRRMVSSGPCSGNMSNEIKITFLLAAKANYTFSNDKGCSPFTLEPNNLKASEFSDRNGSYIWYAEGKEIGRGLAFPGYVIDGDNRLVEIKLVVTSNKGCVSDEFKHTFSTYENIEVSYSQNTTTGCGPLTVVFTNKSTSLTRANFKWDFGNGSTSNLANPPEVAYLPDPSGKDRLYEVTLTAETSCGVLTQHSTVLVKGSPVSVFSPDRTTGCSPFTVTFLNTSPGDSNTYYYDFGDGTTLVATEKNSVKHTYTTLTVKDFVVKMIAKNECGTNESQYSIHVSPNDISPALVVNSNEKSGCAPLKVNFFNNTKGANTFVYDFGDGNKALTNSAPEVMAHTFTMAGTYTVTLYASNNCSKAIATQVITVLEQPLVAFSSDKMAGCSGLSVKFKNTSDHAITYLWDFGDGKTSTEFEPTHVFTGSGVSYNIVLTATNETGCSNSYTASEYIKLVAPPKAAFTVSPGNQQLVPNYTFNFKDQSKEADGGRWEWDFGDGNKSTQQNPVHTYGSAGEFNVALTVYNKEGCTANTFQLIRVIDIPGTLNVPNAFMPASAKNDIKIFKPKGVGMEEWHITVFNKWGQLLWESNKLEDGSPAEGWDGTFNGQDQPQGTYFWKIDVKFINKSGWKGMTYSSAAPRKTGVIYLIR